MNLQDLKKPFQADCIEWRIGRCGTFKKDGVDTIWATALAYITSRAVHDRLDEVCGPESWQMRYSNIVPIADGKSGAICEIGIKINNEWVWKCGGSDTSDFEAFKGMLSGAEKRAAVPWGIGRYLYGLSEDFVEISTEKIKGWNKHYDKKLNTTFWWKSPELPAWALPADQAPTPPTQSASVGGVPAAASQTSADGPKPDGYSAPTPYTFPVGTGVEAPQKMPDAQFYKSAGKRILNGEFQKTNGLISANQVVGLKRAITALGAPTDEVQILLAATYFNVPKDSPDFKYCSVENIRDDWYAGVVDLFGKGKEFLARAARGAKK